MRNRIFVVSDQEKWKVICEHCNSGVINTQKEAIIIAKRHVASQPQGMLNQIFVQNGLGKFRTEWTYGKDPFPPRG